jgi:hypothetical protein
LVSGDGKVTLSGSGGGITGSAISGGSITGSTINVPNASNPSFSVNASGILTAKGATLTTLTVHGSAVFKESATVNIQGPLGINVTPESGYDLKVKGKSHLQGNIGIGGIPSSNYLLHVHGAS